MKPINRIGTFAFLIFLICSCTQKAEKEISKKIAAERHIQSFDDFDDESVQVINRAEGVSDVQKAKLIVLRREILNKIEEKDKEELRLRIVLLKEILNLEPNDRQIQLIKRQLKKIGSSKISLITDAVKESYDILGRPYQKSTNKFEHTVREHDLR